MLTGPYALLRKLAFHAAAAFLVAQTGIAVLNTRAAQVKAGLKSKLSWVMTAGLEDLEDPDYKVGGESDPAVRNHHDFFHNNTWGAAPH